MIPELLPISNVCHNLELYGCIELSQIGNLSQKQKLFGLPLPLYLYLILLRQFNLTFFTGDCSVEMMDNRTKKMFLKKTVTTEVN